MFHYLHFSPPVRNNPLPLIPRPSLTHISNGPTSLELHQLDFTYSSLEPGWRAQAKMYLKERDQINSILYWTSSIDVQYDGHKRDY